MRQRAIGALIRASFVSACAGDARRGGSGRNVECAAHSGRNE
jgi:hypothetical protein